MQNYQRLYDIGLGIAQYLANQQTKAGFPARSFYGEAYSILLWSFFNQEFDSNITDMIEVYCRKDKGSKNFHWEFNNYALQEYYFTTKDKRVEPFLHQLKFREMFLKKVANFVLLRSLVRIKSHKSFLKSLGITQANLVLKFEQTPEGGILDDRLKNILRPKPELSHQYHAFSLALLSEIYEQTGIESFKQAFLQGIVLISREIKETGEAIYKGRGNRQIFGYASLIYALTYAHKLTQDNDYCEKMDIVLSYLNSFKRDDGSFPLVLREEEQGFPVVIKEGDPNYEGWHSYNNYFDYLPFLGCYLLKTYHLLCNRWT